MEAICKANNLRTLDIVNSQLAIMNRVMPDLGTEDRELFRSLTLGGNFYESICELLSLSNRKEAKRVVFEMMFSARRNRSENLAKLRKAFPSVMEWVDGYKEMYGDNQFAIMLQKAESEMFVDGILKRVKAHGYLCFTKHDSIIYRREDAEVIEAIVEGYFAEIDFKCKYKIEDYL
jgi:hypothetical protein